MGKTKDGRSIVNGYVLTSRLGAGSFGTVHLVVSLAHGRQFAMKILSRTLLKKKRFGSGKTDTEILLEVAVMKRLAHPKCVAAALMGRRGGASAHKVPRRNTSTEIHRLTASHPRSVVQLFEVIDDPAGDKFIMVRARAVAVAV